MTEFLYTLVIIFGIVLISILLINVKYFFFKGKPLEKTCASAAGESCVCESGNGRSGHCENKLEQVDTTKRATSV